VIAAPFWTIRSLNWYRAALRSDSVRKLTNETVLGVRYRWYVIETGFGSVGNEVIMVR
jgi:hypothetical protein